MNDESLIALLDDIESDRVERKESIADGDKIRQAICAFANDLADHKKPVVRLPVPKKNEPLRDCSAEAAELAIQPSLAQ